VLIAAGVLVVLRQALTEPPDPQLGALGVEFARSQNRT
jgi:hypothetical protein